MLKTSFSYSFKHDNHRFLVYIFVKKTPENIDFEEKKVTERFDECFFDIIKTQKR